MENKIRFLESGENYMKKLDDIQKLIWECSAQVKLPSPPNKEEVWMRLSQNMDITDKDMDMKQDRQHLAPPTQGIWSALKPRLNYAVALGLAFVMVLPFAYDSLTTESIVTKATDFETVQLPDGSTITLNAGSQIKYKKDFNSDHRTLTLFGEAYFDVQKGRTPFIVNTNHGQVTVLGTAFNVRTREDGFEVGVKEGIVQVANEAKAVILNQGQMLDVETDFDETNLQNVSYSNYPDWMHKKLVCDQTPLSEVCGEIERTFGISFEFATAALAEITVTGVIDAQDLNTVLSTISLLTQHEFKFDGEMCTII
jgi:ferric-dicitrate binding protein FerR (iron transport regulator)